VQPFSYERASTPDEAVRKLAEAGTVPLGGGTDLLVSVREGLASPDRVLDLRGLSGGRDIGIRDDGGARLGAEVSLSALAADPRTRERWPVLAEACAAVGTPALRNMGTLGGNLCQRPRCWYFRRGIACHRGGGDHCPAHAGEHQYLGVFGEGPCRAVHPSDPAVALVALDAVVEVRGSEGTRRLPIAEFYVDGSRIFDRETALRPGEFVVAVELPGASAGGVQRYEKVMQRGAWDFALVSLAAVRRVDGAVRLVLGGVAAAPWRIDASVEEDVASGGLDADDAATLADRALYDAAPWPGNAYKVEIAHALLRRAILVLAA
jgi:xanthine dehydrogenase YagS FAD-binding subunit